MVRVGGVNLPSLPMQHEDKMRIRAAAFSATQVYPGPVGELLARELLGWEEFGYRFGGSSLINALIDHIMEEKRARERASYRPQS